MTANISIKNNSTEHAGILSSSISEDTKVKAKVIHIKAQINNSKQDQAAICIQKHIRGYLTRKPLLSTTLYNQYKVQCEKAKDPEFCHMPRARAGKTKVYLPQDMAGVVLKASGKFVAIRRFHQMQEVRAVLSSQNSSHLIIPKARLCQGFLVEERLPINANQYHNMGLYLANPDLFDEAVREFTRLFSKIHISQLITHLEGAIEGTEYIVRYDNIPLYIMEKNGKKEGYIGLIDLEHAKSRPSPKGLETIARIFPFHLKIIKEEASKLGIDINDDALQAAAEGGKRCLQIEFIDNLSWLKQRGISTDNAFQIFELSPERMNELTDLIEKEILKLNDGTDDLHMWSAYIDRYEPHKKFLRENPEKVAKEIACAILPLIINNLKHEITKGQNKLSTKNLDETQMLELRSPTIYWKKICRGVDDIIAKNASIQHRGSRLFSEFGIAQHLIYCLFQELIKGGEIFLFDPAYFMGADKVFWLRY